LDFLRHIRAMHWAHRFSRCQLHIRANPMHLCDIFASLCLMHPQCRCGIRLPCYGHRSLASLCAMHPMHSKQDTALGDFQGCANPMHLCDIFAPCIGHTALADVNLHIRANPMHLCDILASLCPMHPQCRCGIRLPCYGHRSLASLCPMHPMHSKQDTG
jgi:hypothetical protein